jgi:hypothetical protein
MTLSRYRFLVLALALACLAALVLSPGLTGGFIFDDKPNLVQNEAIHLATLDTRSLLSAVYSFQPGGGSRALAELTFAIDYWRGGLDPTTFKATNLLIHAMTTVALAYLFRLLLITAGAERRRAELGALALALGWAVHPLQVSSVLYVVQRMQTMCTLFMVLALWAYTRGRQAQRGGERARLYWVLTLLFWVLGFASKEDAVLVPLYTLALELTLLRFAASDPNTAARWRRSYTLVAAAGAAGWLLVVAPHFWRWDAYPGRDFSTYERLLTQGRVLMTYLGQILLPVPQQLPFYYDGFAVSRGLLSPPSTLFALVGLAALFAFACIMRARRPLLALGIFLFFAGHFLTSNVIGLELAFEHRNHFPLIGVVLAVADGLYALMQRVTKRPAALVILGTVLLASEAGACAARARTWGEPMALARANTVLAPGSARAWLDLCGLNYELSGKKAGAHLDLAIDACQRGARMPYSAAASANVVLFKTIRGDVTATDWEGYLDRLRRVPMGAENKYTLWVMLGNANSGVALDENRLFSAIDIVAGRTGFDEVEYARLGYFALQKTHQPDRALSYFRLAVQAAPPGSPLIPELVADLRAGGRAEWGADLEALARREGKL